MNEGPSLKISIYCDCLQFLISPAAHQTIPGVPGPVRRWRVSVAPSDPSIDIECDC